MKTKTDLIISMSLEDLQFTRERVKSCLEEACPSCLTRGVTRYGFCKDHCGIKFCNVSSHDYDICALIRGEDEAV